MICVIETQPDLLVPVIIFFLTCFVAILFWPDDF